MRFRALAVSVTAAIVVAGCSNSVQTPRDSASPASTSPSSAHLPTSSGAGPSATSPAGSATSPAGSAASLAGGHLATLGDSYTAGTWTGPTGPSPAAFCAQATTNYPRQVARALGMSLSDASCNGARTGNVAQPQDSQGEEAPAQLNAVRADTRLVTIALGVNDNRLFADVVVGCSRFAAQSPNGAPCRDRVLGADPNPVDQIPTVTASLVRDIQLIKARAPQARVVLLGYPQVLPNGTTCPQRWPIAIGDAAWVNQSLDRLDEAIKAAAVQTGSTFFDLRPVTADHTVCSADPWFNGSSVAGRDGATYHPRSGYMTGVAKALVAFLN